MHVYMDKNGLDDSYAEMSDDDSHLRHSEYMASSTATRKRNMKKG